MAADRYRTTWRQWVVVAAGLAVLLTVAGLADADTAHAPHHTPAPAEGDTGGMTGDTP